MKNVDSIHSRAIDVARRYKDAEVDLLEILQEVEKHRVHYHKGCSSLFDYTVQKLRLSEDVAYSLIRVFRKSREVPELKEAMRAGEMTLTNAKRIASVLSPKNQQVWIQKAKTLSSRQLEKELAAVNPKLATPERATYVAYDRLKLQLGLSEESLAKLKRVQDLLSQRRRAPVSLEETIEAMTSEYLEKNDPVIKAKKLVARPNPVAVIHQVKARDQGKCGHPGCTQTRWLDIHHIKPRSEGGQDTIDNLITLCSGHHRFLHETMRRNPFSDRA